MSKEIRRGNEFEETDANGYIRKFIKGEDGELLSYVDSDGFEYNTEYNSDGLISAFVNPDGSNTRVNYDDEGRIRTIVNPDGSEVTFTYDSNDRVVCRNVNLVFLPYTIICLCLPAQEEKYIHYKFIFCRLQRILEITLSPTSITTREG